MDYDTRNPLKRLAHKSSTREELYGRLQAFGFDETEAARLTDYLWDHYLNQGEYDMSDDAIKTAQDIGDSEFCDECGTRLNRYGECYECDDIEYLQE